MPLLVQQDFLKTQIKIAYGKRIEKKEQTFQTEKEFVKYWKPKLVEPREQTLQQQIKTIYQGSTYAIRKLSKPYRVSVEFANLIHGGINYNKQKNREFFKTTILPHGAKGASGAPKNIFGIGLGVGSGLVSKQKCDDVYDPNSKILRRCNNLCRKVYRLICWGSINRFRVLYKYSKSINLLAL